MENYPESIDSNEEADNAGTDGPKPEIRIVRLPDDTPEEARERYGFKQGYIGRRGIRKTITTPDGTRTSTGSNHTPQY